MLMPDVKGAFDNFSDERLLPNLHKRRMRPRVILYGGTEIDIIICAIDLGVPRF